MVYKGRRLKRIIAGVILICALFAPVFINYNFNKTRLEPADKMKIEALILKSKGSVPNLQTDNTLTDWAGKSIKEQTQLMDEVLSNITEVRSSISGKPQKYISAYYQNISIYIPYSDFNPAGSIIIKAYDNFYLARCSTSDSVQKVISYMIKENAIK